MACGGCGGQPARMPLTSGDFNGADPVAPGAATFKVLGSSYEPPEGTEPPADAEAGAQYFPTYRAARVHQSQYGGTLRAV